MFLKEIVSPHYGKMIYRLAGIVDIKAMSKLDNFSISEWFEHHHPKNTFSAFSIQQIEDSKHTIKNFESFAVYVPLKEDNKDWQPEPEHSYYQHWKSSKKIQKLGLVVAVTEEKLQKWQATAQNILTPDYYFTSSNFEELKNNFNKLHNYV